MRYLIALAVVAGMAWGACRRIARSLGLLIAVTLFLWTLLITTASAKQPPKPPCRCISHVERKDSVYYECQCPKGVTPHTECAK
jgi:hypothetical protein